MTTILEHKTSSATKATSTDSTNSLTISNCLDAILKDYQENHGNEDTDSFPKEEYDYVCSLLDITPIQAVLLSAIVEISVAADATPDRIAKSLGCTNLRFLDLKNEIDILVEKRYLRASMRGFRGLNYRIPDNTLKSIQKNIKPDFNDIRGLSTSSIFRRMNSLFREFWRDNIDLETLDNETMDLLQYNKENAFVTELDKIDFQHFPSYERLVFFYMVSRMVIYGEEQFGMEDYGKVLQDGGDDDLFSIELAGGDLNLLKHSLVEFACTEGIADPNHICLTDKVTQDFLKGTQLCPPKRLNGVNLIDSSSIASKELFYNEDIQGQVDSLCKLLSAENFDGIVERLREKGLRCGFNCLFFGPAGTGKTETVNQISKATGRDIYLVDVSEIKSKWVGESEKNIKALFREYRKLVKSSKLCPILLFNEADAIFGVRKKGAESAVDKMENSIQNIILQEMESLEGILIATTNLTKNFDSAFERRFIYKIKFDKPGLEARAKIWMSQIEELDHKDAEKLAQEFDFSGGQIENISRKMEIEYILSGKTPGFESIREFCCQETLDAPHKRAKIGF